MASSYCQLLETKVNDFRLHCGRSTGWARNMIITTEISQVLSGWDPCRFGFVGDMYPPPLEKGMGPCKSGKGGDCLGSYHQVHKACARFNTLRPLLITLNIRPHKKKSWLASLAFAKKWAGGRFFLIFTDF